jgi:hypothetical protein
MLVRGCRPPILDNLRDALDEALEMNRQDARAAAAGAFEEVSLAPPNSDCWTRSTAARLPSPEQERES